MQSLLALAVGCGGLALGLAWIPAAAGQAPPEPVAGGVVLTTVAERSALHAAGVREGDRIVSWRRPIRESADAGSRQGEIRSAFDWEWVKVEQAPRGVVELLGRRGAEPKVFSVSAGSWRGDVRPELSREALQGLREGLELIASGQPAAGIRRLHSAAAPANDAAATGSRDLSCWLSFRGGDALAAAGRLSAALAAYETALAAARDPASQVVIWDAIGDVRLRLGEASGAQAAYQAALEIRRLGASQESLSVAKSWTDLGDLAWNRGELQLAAEQHRRALDIRQVLAPGSLAVAESLKALGMVAGLAGDLAAAVDHTSRALRVQEQLAPGSLAVAESLNHLGIFLARAGRRAQAEDYFSRSLAIREALEPGRLGVAATSINLGRIAWKRGDLDGARHRYRAALAIQEKLAPGSQNLATLLTNLGLLELDQGRFEAAESYYQRALAIREKLEPDSIFVADSFFHLGRIALERGQLATAERDLARALSIQENTSPGSLFHADTLFHLGKVAAVRGDRVAARRYHRQALRIHEELAPDSKEEAESLHALGQLQRTTDPQQAARLFERAIDSLEAQIGTLGGSEDVKRGFRARHRAFYQDSIDVLLELDREAEAFHILERSRARSFLAMLAERELLFSLDLPAELATARRTLALHYDRTLEKLFRVSPGEGERFATLVDRLASLRRDRDRLIADVRRASRRFGELHYPQPLDLAGAREALDAGSLMLSYYVGPSSTHLFALTRDRFEVVRVEIVEEDLRARIRLFRRLIQATGSATGIQAIRRSQLVSAGRQLYRDLVRPVAQWIDRSERLLIIPDGPLHILPFRTLILDQEDGTSRSGDSEIGTPAAGTSDARPDLRYLIEWKPLHTALSATVFSELKKSRGSPGGPSPVGRHPVARGPVQLTAFGDPLYPQERQDLSPLPYSRREVERIVALHPPPGVRAYLGAAATEEQAKAVGRETRILHFATHAILDDRLPLHSALALSIPGEPAPGRDNGLLQTFEIFEGLRLDAELVILSACETALGQELAGEGLIGLTRAFQYAGARSVAASLWSVRDEATADLMVRFHRYLKGGSSKAEALRAAQVELIRGGVSAEESDSKTALDTSSPFFWAAFELYGDWR